MAYFECSSAGGCLRAVEALLFLAMSVSSVQYLFNNNAYGPRGLFSWRLQKYLYQVKELERPVYDRLFGRTGFILLHAGRVLLMGFAFFSSRQAPALTGLFVLNGILYLRSILSVTAADQMNMIVLFCLLVSAWFPLPGVLILSLGGIATQTLICYWCNGLTKALEPAWRNGSALRGVLQTEDYSRSGLSALAGDSPAWVVRRISQLVIVWELSSFLAPFVPPGFLWIYLGIGIAFHLAVALVMGLNGFFWTFIATYPAILFLNSRVQQLL